MVAVIARPMTPRPVQHGGGVELDPCSSRPEPPSVLRVRADCGAELFTAKPGSALFHASGVRSVAGGSSDLDSRPALSDRCNGLRMRSLKPRPSPIVQPSHPSAVRDPASGANSAHPSPSGRHFGLPFNKLAPSELRRIFCSVEPLHDRIALLSSDAAVHGSGPGTVNQDAATLRVASRSSRAMFPQRCVSMSSCACRGRRACRECRRPIRPASICLTGRLRGNAMRRWPAAQRTGHGPRSNGSMNTTPKWLRATDKWAESRSS